MPGVATYLVLPARRAAIAPSLMCSGVSKSGSPAAKLQTSSPAAWRALALASTASVGEGATLRAQVERGGRGEGMTEGLIKKRSALRSRRSTAAPAGPGGGSAAALFARSGGQALQGQAQEF